MKLSITSKSARLPSAEVLAWDTEFWGVRIGRSYSSDVDRWARENMVGSICLLVPLADTQELHRAEDRGFRVMDIRITLERPTQGRTALVRPAEPADTEALARIARESHRITRFYADPRFPDDRCDDLYETWIRSSLDGWADAVLVPAGGNGYVTVHHQSDVSTIGLIAVSEEARGHGLGTELVCGATGLAFEHGAKTIRVVTQARNTPALRVFERCGFMTVSAEAWMHRHYEETS